MTLQERVDKLRRDVANMFIDLRLEAGWSRKEAARNIDVVYSNLTRVEAAGTNLRLSTLQRYAAAYGYDVEISFIPIEEDDATTGVRSDSVQSEASV